MSSVHGRRFAIVDEFLKPPDEPQPQPLLVTPPGKPSRRRLLNAGIVLFALAAMSLIGAAAGYYLLYPSRIGPAQPIAFSHRLHVTDKKLNCMMCHNGVTDTPRAGVPPMETCMMCHSRVIIHHPQIRTLWQHYEQETPVEWVRVNDLPDYVFFNHQVHVRKGFDCGQCHGAVSEMDRVYLVQKFQMGFCVQCHRDNGTSHDCLTCHR